MTLHAVTAVTCQNVNSVVQVTSCGNFKNCKCSTGHLQHNLSHLTFKQQRQQRPKKLAVAALGGGFRSPFDSHFEDFCCLDLETCRRQVGLDPRYRRLDGGSMG